MSNQSTSLDHRYILALSFISALGGYLFGFDFAVIAGALPFLKVAFGLNAWWEGFLTGSLALGCIAGSLIAGSLADRFGRKPGLITAALIFALSSLGMAIAPEFIFFVAMRFCAGIGVGMASMLSPLYIAEISPANKRGRNVAINQLTIVTGILITNLVNYNLAGKGAGAWRWMFGLGVAPSGFFMLGLIWLPESPRWLVKTGQLDKAEAILQKIGNAAYARQTVKDIQSSFAKDVIKRSYAAVFSRPMRPALLLGIALAVLQQFCGINVVFNYTSTIFESVGAKLNEQLIETVAIGAINLVFTIVAMWQVDRIGRRPLMLYGSAGLAIWYILLAALLMHHAPAGWVSLIVLASIATYSVSLAPVTWVLIAEIFPNKIRGLASSLAIVSLWTAYFLLVFTFPVLAKKLGVYGPFWMYSGICLLGLLFIKTRVKETKGKTLEELEELLVQH